MYFLGDPHGDWRGIIFLLRLHHIRDAILVILGDMGVGFLSVIKEMEELKLFDSQLRDLNIQVYVVRGNHDKPSYFTCNWDNTFTNIHFQADYSVVELEGMQVLFVGGAHSIDHAVRILDVNLWADEDFVFQETDAEPDIVVSHIPPAFVLPTVNPKYGEKTIVERHLCSKLYDHLKKKPKLWMYGHYHDHYYTYYEDTQFRGLAIMELYEYRKSDAE